MKKSPESKVLLSSLSKAHLAALRDHYCQKMGIDPQHFIPIGIHGDGVPTRKRKGCDVFSWNFVAEPDLDRYLATLIPKDFECQCGCKGRHTTEASLNRVCAYFI